MDLSMTVPFAAVSGTALQSGGPSWWQVAGALAAVLALLFLTLRLLSRWHRTTAHDQAALLTVWPLGPRREIQIIRLYDEVHFVYRHEGGLVVLRREPWESYRTGVEASPDRNAPFQRLLRAVTGRGQRDDFAA
jgi:hypothetical protein